MEEKIAFAYDKEGDVLDISIGKPQSAISREIEDDFFVRLDPDTERIVGFSILNFEKWFKTKALKTVPVTGNFSLVKEMISVHDKRASYKKLDKQRQSTYSKVIEHGK